LRHRLPCNAFGRVARASRGIVEGVIVALVANLLRLGEELTQRFVAEVTLACTGKPTRHTGIGVRCVDVIHVTQATRFQGRKAVAIGAQVALSLACRGTVSTESRTGCTLGDRVYALRIVVCDCAGVALACP